MNLQFNNTNGNTNTASGGSGSKSNPLTAPLVTPQQQLTGLPSSLVRTLPYSHSNAQSQSQSQSQPANAASSPIDREAPYIAVDGRRKRRRTTFEDAFHQCLSMTVMDNETATTTTPTPRDEHAHANNTILQDDEIMTPVKDDIHNNNKYDSPVTREGGISKRLDYQDYEEMPPLQPTIYRMRMSCTDIPGKTDDDEEESMFSNPDSGGDAFSYSGTSSSSNSNSNSNSSSTSVSASAPASASLPVLFAPRKAKKHAEHLDPVDERIEELIRHSRIKALMLSNREKQKQKAYEKCKSQQMDEKEMDRGDDGGGGDSGGGARSSSSSSAVDVGVDNDNDNTCTLRRKNEKEKSLFTGKSTDDFHATDTSTWRTLERRGSSFMSITSGSLLSGDEATYSSSNSRSRSNSVPRTMKYSESMDVEMS